MLLYRIGRCPPNWMRPQPVPDCIHLERSPSFKPCIFALPLAALRLSTDLHAAASVPSRLPSLVAFEDIDSQTQTQDFVTECASSSSVNIDVVSLPY